MSVYFAQREKGGLIKIGWSDNVPNRITALKAKLLGAVPGGKDAEDELHKRFASLREKGEWFRPEEALINFIRDETQEHEPDYKNVQTALRLSQSSLALADKIAERMSRGGFPTTRTEVLRAAVAAGLKTLEKKKR